MNKAYLMSFVLAAALPAVAAEEQYDPLFKGVKDGALVSNDGGTWTTTGATVAPTNSSTAVAFETTAPIKLSVTADAADTNTIAKVELQVTLADVGDFMNDLPQGAQVAFCVCTNSFNAWNGSTWVALNEVPAGVDDSQTTNLTVEISYQGTSARKARFTVGDTALVTRDGSLDWVDLCGTGVTSKNNLEGFGINGEGIIAQADASVMLGVAEYADVKYGTISNAVEVAKNQIGEFNPIIEVIRETDEDVTSYLSGDGAVRIDTADDVAVTVSPTESAVPAQGVAEGASGQYTATVDSSVLAKIEDTANIKIALPGSMSATKEVKPGSVKVVDGGTATFEVRTASSIVKTVAPGGKALSANVEKLQEFLAKTAKAKTAVKEAYEKAAPTAGELALALAADGENGIPMYQSYALGIDQGTSVKPVTIANDAAQGAITLSVPALANSELSGDYNTVKYEMTGPNDSKTYFTGKDAQIQVPLTTGSYTVKIVME